MTATRSQTGLHVCPSCVSELVQPTSWAPAALDSWYVDLHCPDCNWRGRAIATQDEVDEYDIVLEDGCRVLHQALNVTGAEFDAALGALFGNPRSETTH